MLKFGTREFELNHIYEIDIPASFITEAGMDQIRDYIERRKYGQDGFIKKDGTRFIKWYPIELENNKIEYVWKTSRGTFPKRLSKYLYEEYEIVLTPNDLEQIGNYAKANTTEQNKFYIRFTQNLDWMDGEFGDEGSCFWGGNSGAREMLEENGAYAIQFYKPNEVSQNHTYYPDNYIGYARAWAVQEKFGLVLFNGYGLVVQQIAQIIATACGLYYRKIELANQGDTTGLLWIGARNGASGGHGWVVGEIDKVKSMTEWDFQWDDHESNYCYRCDDRIHGESDQWEFEGNYYCEDCFNHIATRCEECGDYVASDSIAETQEGDCVCGYCLERYYQSCDECEDMVHTHHINYLENLEMDVCNNCLETEFSICDQCGDYHYHRDLENDLCENCRVVEEEA